MESIAGDLDTIATALKTMRGQGSMHPTAAAAFDLMLNAQVSHATDLAKFTKLDADTVRHTVTITEWADEQSVVNGPGWRPGKPARFLDGN